MEDIIQFDPALKELLFYKTGSRLGEFVSEEIGLEQIPVVVRLVHPDRPVPGLTVVSQFGSVVTGRVALNRIVQVRTDANVASLKASRIFSPAMTFPGSELGDPSEFLRQAISEGVTGSGVVIGFADWGLDFAHANFRNRTGETRLLCLWDQRGGPHPASPDAFGYGREFSRDQLNAALASSDPYTFLNYDPMDADVLGNGTHATHVVDIAAGNGSAPGSAPGVAPEADIIFVHLKGEDTRLGDTLGDSVRLLEATRYIADHAGNRPVVLNYSLGRTIGSHDGRSLVEIGLDALLEERRGLAIVMSCGNYFTAEMHSSGRVQAGEFVDLQWRATPQNDEITEIEIWYSHSDEFAVELIDPVGRILAKVQLGGEHIVRDGDQVIATLYHRPNDPNNGDNQIVIFLWADAMTGTWIVRLYGETVRDGTFHGWIERDDPVFQSRFTPDCATSTTTTGTICNGCRTIAVGAYDARQVLQPIVPFSSAGPTRDLRQKPDISAPGAGIRAARSSRPLNGLRDLNGTTIKSGTSMAAPYVSGVIALMFEAAGSYRLSADETKEILMRTARRSPPYNDLDRMRYGAGRIDAVAAIKAVRELTLSNATPDQVSPSESIEFSISTFSTPVANLAIEDMSVPDEESSQDLAAWGESARVATACPDTESTVESESCGNENSPVGNGAYVSYQSDSDEALLRKQLGTILPRLLITFGDSELQRAGKNGKSVYDKLQPLLFAPAEREYSLSNGKFNYHAANFVYNTAYRLGYDVPVYPRSSSSAKKGRSYNNTAATFEAIANLVNGNSHNYFGRFFEVVAYPGQLSPLAIKEGDLLLRAPESGVAFGHVAIIADSTLYDMTEAFFSDRDSTQGQGVQCIDAGLSIHTRQDRYGRVLVDGVGRVLVNRMVLRFKESAIDIPRVLEQMERDKNYLQLINHG